MTYSFQNLQDFVLNLLNDEAAQTAYAADPTAALSQAGLGDLTPQDVQEVIPLVTDALPTETPLGDFAVDVTGVMDGADTLGSSLGASNGLGELGVWGLQTDNGDVGLWGGSATDLLGRVAGGVEAGPDGLAAAATTPLGYTDFDTNGNYHVIPADPADVVANLGNTGDAVAGTVTHMMGDGASTMVNTVDTGGDTLAGFLAGTPAGPVADMAETGTDMVANNVAQGSDMFAQHTADLPAAGDLAGLPAVPDLPEVPGLGDLPAQLPGLDALPVDVPDLGDLPANLPVALPALPVDVPDTSAVTNVLQHNPVTDAVGSSPVGGLTDSVHGVTDHLPAVGDVTDHLDLGL
ncbi:MAG TPA: IniB N-terminal domain-containing protein [Actinophytocola sp.]|nr:IniB N-terminal domain-containing protein [Actinophytocola sp.]